MRWAFAGLLLFIAAITLQLHFIAWTLVLVLLIWQLAQQLIRSWLEGVEARRVISQTAAEVGDVVEVQLQFRCGGRWPLLWALCEELLPDLPAGREKNWLKLDGQTAGILQASAGPEQSWTYLMKCQRRGYYQIGPLVMETGDVFGMDRRFRVLAPPVWLLVRPEVIPLEGYDVQSRRPIGEIVMTHRLFEDPTRTSGVRQYQAGDPLNRVHWRATARSGTLQSRVFEATSLAGATVLVDFHVDSFAPEDQPHRSELAIVAAASISHLLYEMNQQSGLFSNGRDAVDRIREEGWKGDSRTREESRASAQMSDTNTRLQPVVIPPSKATERLSLILDQLARLELSDGLTLMEALSASYGRLPRDASVIAIVSQVNESIAGALESLKRQGYFVTAIVNIHDDEAFLTGSSWLARHSIPAIHLKERDQIPVICRSLATGNHH